MAPRRRAESTPSRNRETEQEPPKEYGILKLIDELGPYLSYARPEDYITELEYTVNTHRLDIRHVLRLVRGTMTSNPRVERLIMLAGGPTKTPKEFLERFREEIFKAHPPLPDYVEELRGVTTNSENSLQARVALARQVWLKTLGEMQEAHDVDCMVFCAIILGLPAYILKRPKFLWDRHGRETLMEWARRMDKEVRTPLEDQPLQGFVAPHEERTARTSEITTAPLWDDKVERLERRLEGAIKELSSKMDAMGRRRSPESSPERQPRKRSGRPRPYQGRTAPRRRENREQRKGTARAPANREQPAQPSVPQYNPYYPPPSTPALNQWTRE